MDRSKEILGISRKNHHGIIKCAYFTDINIALVNKKLKMSVKDVEEFF